MGSIRVANRNGFSLFVALLIFAIVIAAGASGYYVFSTRVSGEEQRRSQVSYPSNLEESAEWRAAIFEYYREFWNGEDFLEKRSRFWEPFIKEYWTRGVPEDLNQVIPRVFEEFVKDQALGLIPVYGQIKLGVEFGKAMSAAVPSYWVFSGESKAYVERCQIHPDKLVNYSKEVRDMMMREEELWRDYERGNIPWNTIKSHLIREKKYLDRINWMDFQDQLNRFKYSKYRQNRDKAKSFESYGSTEIL